WEEPNRYVAASLLANPGYVLALRTPDGKETRASRADELPAGPFTVVEVSKPNPGLAYGDADLKRLASLPALERLAIVGHQLTGEGLRELGTHRKTLRGLWLDYGPITDQGVKTIAEQANVTTLAVRGTKVTDAGLAHLARLSGLESLGLDQTAVTDAGLKH